MTAVYLFIGILLLPVLLVCNAPVDRIQRSDRNLDQFASAINGALRLRYGKRSEDLDLLDKLVQSPQVKDRYFGPSYNHFNLPM
uniref:Peptide n=1 Tax=Elaeophora elaphi TaxID=1147741 RepID=A0A158Q7N2_9BILA